MPLSELSEERVRQMYVLDRYPSEQIHFHVQGYNVTIENENLANAVMVLSGDKRDIVLLAYFLDMTDQEIADTLDMVRRTVQYSSEFLYKCWKRFRKYGATLTGITQNVEECLLSNTARMMFANSEFLLMLNQATTDREQLARLLGASDTQMSYVDNAPAGHGLIKVGGAIVPFANELPKNTELYRLMSTRPGED